MRYAPQSLPHSARLPCLSQCNAIAVFSLQKTKGPGLAVIGHCLAFLGKCIPKLRKKLWSWLSTLGLRRPTPEKRGYRRCGVLGLDLSGLATYQKLRPSLGQLALPLKPFSAKARVAA